MSVDEAQLLRELGVPEDLLPHSWVASVADDHTHPMLELPADWTPDAVPRLARVREAIDAGMGLVISGEVNLLWFEASITRVTALLFQSDLPIHGVELLETARELRELRIPFVPRVVDLSRLPNLRTVAISGSSLFSALRAPLLMDAQIAGIDALDDRIELASSIERLAVIARNVDLGHLSRSLPRLAALHLGRVDQDVSASRGRVLTGDATRDL